jgi:Putative zincin peptidase
MTDRDATMSVARANLLAIAWLPVSALLALGPFAFLWGSDRIASAIPAATDLRLALPVLIVSVLLHEALHALGFLAFGHVPRSAVRVGFQRRTLTPYASCTVPVPARVYRLAALLPGVVLGGLPILAGWGLGSGASVLYGWAMVAIAGGDLAAIWAIRDVGPGVLVLDHPSRVGCQVTEQPAV